jgi:hypothetical protein
MSMLTTMTHRRVLVLAAVTAAFGYAPVAAPYTPVAVVATPRTEIQPAASPDYLVYSEVTRRRPNTSMLFAKPAAAPRFRVNPPRTRAFAGSIHGNTLVYSQRTPSGRGEIKLFDLVSRTISNPPGVNTAAHESGPALSGDWLVFTRAERPGLSSPRRLILHHLTDGSNRQLDNGANAYVQGGGVAGSFVAWTRCRFPTRCRTWLYDIGLASKHALPNPLAKSQFAASVSADGTVYYAESGTISCGARKVVRFWRQPLVGPRVLIGRLPRGRDTAMTSPVVMGDGSVELSFDRFICRTGAADIYRFMIPTAPR